MAKIELTECKHCGRLFVPEHYNIRLCSEECRAAARKISVDRSNAKAREAKKVNPIQKRCLVCHHKFRTNRSDVVTCSPHCQRIRNLEKMKEYAEKQRIEKKQKPMSIAEFNRKAREMGMSYGQYDLYLRMHGKEKQNVL